MTHSRPMFVLLPGAGSTPWYWHRVDRELRALGHAVTAVRLPCEERSAGLAEYADTVVSAVGERREVVVVSHSFGAFTAPLVCARLSVRALVLVAPMIPASGESAAQWWERTGQPEAQRDFALREGRDPDAEPSLDELFLHDLPPNSRRPHCGTGSVNRRRPRSNNPGPWPRGPTFPHTWWLFGTTVCSPWSSNGASHASACPSPLTNSTVATWPYSAIRWNSPADWRPTLRDTVPVLSV